MSDQIGAIKMRELGDVVSKRIPGLGYAILIFEFHNSGIANYVSNANREDMIKCLEETLERFKSQQDFKTPEEN